MYPLLPDRVEVDRDDKGELYYVDNRYSDENPNFGEYGRVCLRQEDVLHIPGLGFDGLVGYSPIAMAKNALGMTLQVDEIARLYRIPPHMVGDLDKSSFSNIEQQSLEFVKYTLDPWVVQWEQSLQKALLLSREKREYESIKGIMVFWELAGGCVCWLFCAPVYGERREVWKNRKVRCRDEAEVLELDTE